jgi:hypothetical protein
MCAAHWPAGIQAAGANSGQHILLSYTAAVAAARLAPPLSIIGSPALPPQQQQQQQHQGGAGLSLPCLRELLGALVVVPSASDALRPHEQALFEYVADAILACSSLMMVHSGGGGGASDAAHEQQQAETSNAQQQQQQQGHECDEQQGAPPGYCSPGVLHLLLGTHLRLLMEAGAGPAAPRAQWRALNALHLLRCLLQRPCARSAAAQALLLPCLARPLAKLLYAGGERRGGALAVQLAALQVLCTLLDRQGADGALLPEVGHLPSAVSQHVAGGAVSCR